MLRSVVAGLFFLTNLAVVIRAQISAETWDKGVRSMDLSSFIYDLAAAADEVGAENVFYDGKDDAALIDNLTYNDTCIVAFRGTVVELDDWVQNFKLVRHVSLCSKADGTTCCDTHRGFVDAYETNYQADLEASIDSCVADGKEIIFTGHSQGAGVALVAGLRYFHVNPKLLVFAATPAFFEPCLGDLITNDIIRFQNTEAHYGLNGRIQRLDYDPTALSGQVQRDIRIPFVDEGVSKYYYVFIIC
jgi:hypothetical protein